MLPVALDIVLITFLFNIYMFSDSDEAHFPLNQQPSQTSESPANGRKRFHKIHSVFSYSTVE